MPCPAVMTRVCSASLNPVLLYTVTLYLKSSVGPSGSWEYVSSGLPSNSKEALVYVVIPRFSKFAKMQYTQIAVPSWAIRLSAE